MQDESSAVAMSHLCHATPGAVAQSTATGLFEFRSGRALWPTGAA